MLSCKSGCIRTKWLYFGKCGHIRVKWLYLVKVDVFGQSGCIRAKVVLLGQKLLYSETVVV